MNSNDPWDEEETEEIWLDLKDMLNKADQARANNPMYWLDPVCSCGSDKVYGPSYSSELHAFYCEKVKK